MQSRDLTERRLDKRFKMKDRVFVELSGKPIKIGEMIDLSAGGLSFRYLDGVFFQKDLEIKMYYIPDRFISEGITVRTVWDAKIIPKFSMGIIKTRRRGAYFENLTEAQKFQIEHLIQNYSIVKA